jgi:hypothetical protein
MTYHTETYPTSIDVLVSFTHNGEVESFDDAIKGNDEAHALERAEWNWPGATIEFLGVSDDTGTAPTPAEQREMYNEFFPGDTDEWADAATWSPSIADEATV